jgi:DNA-binding response OmpR family regulator
MARILVVDDQVQILKLLEGILGQSGHDVTTAIDTFDALAKLAGQTFEMIITDAIMPGGASGFDLVRTVRSKPEYNGMPIILLTGRREKKDVARGIEAGVDDYVVKPLDPDLFLAKVDMLLLKRNSSTVFTECSVTEEATHRSALKIIGVSEIGLTFQSPHPFHPGSKIEIESGFFDKVGISAPVMRVISSAPGNDENIFLVKLQFIGMTEESLQPLRVWLRSRTLSKAA